MAMTPLKRPTLDELVAPLLADGLPLPTPLRWALDQDPLPLEPSTRSAWPEWASANGYSVEQIAILKARIGNLTHSGPCLKSLAADLYGRHDVNGEFVDFVSVYDRHSAALTLHTRALAKAEQQRSEKTSPRAVKPPPETAPSLMPPQRHEAQQSQPPPARPEREPLQKCETIRLGGLWRWSGARPH